MADMSDDDNRNARNDTMSIYVDDEALARLRAICLALPEASE